MARPMAFPATHWKVARELPMALAATEAVPRTETVERSRIFPSWNMLLSRPLVTPKRRMFRMMRRSCRRLSRST